MMVKTSPGHVDILKGKRTVAESLADAFMLSFAGAHRSDNGVTELLTATLSAIHPIHSDDPKVREAAKRQLRRLVNTEDRLEIGRVVRFITDELSSQDVNDMQLEHMVAASMENGQSLAMSNLIAFGHGYYKATQDRKTANLIDLIVNTISAPDPVEMTLRHHLYHLMTVLQLFYLLGCQLNIFTEQTRQLLSSVDYELWSPVLSDCGKHIRSSRYNAISWLLDMDCAESIGMKGAAVVTALSRLKGPEELSIENAAWSEACPASLPVEKYIEYFAGSACSQRTHIILRQIQLFDRVQRRLLQSGVKPIAVVAAFDLVNKAAMAERDGFRTKFEATYTA